MKAIENLMKKKGRFDYILLETTGLADPGTVCILLCHACNPNFAYTFYLQGQLPPCFGLTVNSAVIFI